MLIVPIALWRLPWLWATPMRPSRIVLAIRWMASLEARGLAQNRGDDIRGQEFLPRGCAIGDPTLACRRAVCRYGRAQVDGAGQADGGQSLIAVVVSSIMISGTYTSIVKERIS